MRKYRGVPRSANPGPVGAPKGQRLPSVAQVAPAPPPAKRTANYRLQPLYDEKGSAVLFDVFEDEAWCGSRRTLSQFAHLVESIRGPDRN